MCTQLQVVLHHLGVTSTLFGCKLTRIPRLHNTMLVFFYPIQTRIGSGSHYCSVNVHHVGVTFTLNWCSHSCKNLHFFGVTITLSLFLCICVSSALSSRRRANLMQIEDILTAGTYTDHVLVQCDLWRTTLQC